MYGNGLNISFTFVTPAVNKTCQMNVAEVKKNPRQETQLFTKKRCTPFDMNPFLKNKMRAFFFFFKKKKIIVPGVPSYNFWNPFSAIGGQSMSPGVVAAIVIVPVVVLVPLIWLIFMRCKNVKKRKQNTKERSSSFHSSNRPSSATSTSPRSPV
jgi:hypothetical protein